MNNRYHIFIGTAVLLLSLTLVHWAGAGQNLKRTNLLVDNLSCSSCLNTIEQELSAMTGFVGMAGDLRRGQILVDHQAAMDEEDIATAITRAGYPARVDWTASITEDKANVFPRSATPSQSCGGGCSSGAGKGSATWGESSGKDIKTDNANPTAGGRAPCGSREKRPCSATASAWKTLYRQYFSDGPQTE